MVSVLIPLWTLPLWGAALAHAVTGIWVWPYTWSGPWVGPARRYGAALLAGTVFWAAWALAVSAPASRWPLVGVLVALPYALTILRATHGPSPGLDRATLGTTLLTALALGPDAWWPPPVRWALAGLAAGLGGVTLMRVAGRWRWGAWLAWAAAGVWPPAAASLGLGWVLLVVRAYRHRLIRDQATLAADPLTGCWPRAAGLARLAETLATQPVGVLFVDADGFKAVNDTWGHAAGDAVLAAVGAALRAAVRRRTDWVVRLGGDEFLCVLPGVPEAEWPALAAALQAACRTVPVPRNGVIHVQTLSCGPAWAPAGTDPAALVAAADAAMYQAKSARRALPAHPPEGGSS